ncbi:MAG: amidohydrolase family protein [Candidatus Micrarchaeota archaeon]
MVLVDGHVHFTKPESGESLKAGRDDSPWVNPDYRGKTLAEFVNGRRECEDYAFLDIVGTLGSAGFPALPHVVDKIYQARTGSGIGRFALLTIDYPGSTQPTNEEMLRLVEAFPEIMGSVSVNPNSENAANRLYERLRKLAELNEKLRNGWRPVVKMHPLQQKFDPGNLGAKELGRMYAMMEEMGAVLVTHTGVFQRAQVEGDVVIADPARLIPVAERHPKLNIVLAHMGTPDIAVVNWWGAQGVQVRHFGNALEMMGRFPNVYGDMGGLLWTGDRPAGVYGECACRNYNFGERAQFGFSNANEILEAERRSLWRTGLRALGFGRNQLHRKLIYGSDFPVAGKGDLEKQIRKLGGFNPAENTAKVFARA